MNTRSTAKGRQDLIQAETTPMNQILDDSTDTGLLEDPNQSQHTEDTELRLNNNPQTNPGLFSTDETKQSNPILTPEMLSQLMAQFTLKENDNKITKKRLRLKDDERRLAMDPNKLNRNADLLEFKEWEQSIRTKTDTKQVFTKLLFTSPTNSWKYFQRHYDQLIEPSDMEEEYLQFHRNLYAWIINSLDDDIARSLRTYLISKPSESNLSKIWRFEEYDEQFFQNCHLAMEWLRDRCCTSTTYTTNRLMLKASTLKYDYTKWPNPSDWINEFINIYNQIKTLQPDFYVPDDDKLPLYLLPLVNIDEIITHITLRAEIPTLSEFKNIMNNWRAKKEAIPQDTAKSYKRDERRIPSRFNQRGRRETSNYVDSDVTLINDEQEGSPIQEGNYKKYPRRKGVCDYYSTPAGCKKGDRCDFLHPQVSLSVLELEKEQAHGMDGSHIGSNNDINAHDTILDSGSSNHSTGLRRMLDDIESRDPITMKTVIGMKKVSEIGTLELNDKVKLNNVRLIEGSPFTLMALAPLVDRGNKAVTFFKDRAIALPSGLMEQLVKNHERHTLLSFKRKGNLWVLPLKGVPKTEAGIEIAKTSVSIKPKSVDPTLKMRIPKKPSLVPPKSSEVVHPASGGNDKPSQPANAAVDNEDHQSEHNTESSDNEVQDQE